MDAERAQPLVLSVGEDLFFSTRIETVARECSIRLRQAADLAQLDQCLEAEVPNLIIVDLNSKTCAPIDSIRKIKRSSRLAGVPVIGFFSHVQVDLERAARAAGCDQILARSAFSLKLHRILSSGGIIKSVENDATA